jgi:superfamily II DNA or RNA helicase
VDDIPRNALLHGLVNDIGPNAHILILTIRVNHCELLYHDFGSAPGIAYIHGGVKQSLRAEVLEQVRNGNVRILIATYALAKEGLDIPILDTLILATPVKDATAITQSVGRIMRPEPGKAAVVYDIYDKAVPACRRQLRERKQVYKSLGCRISEAKL